MIKNLLYSLFLHFILLAAIYVNFNLKNQEEKISEIVVTMNLDIDHNSNSNKPADSSRQEKKEEVKKEVKKKAPEIKEKKAPQKKITKQQKKTSSKSQSIKKESLESNKQEFKTPEKEEDKEKKEKNPEEKIEEKLEKEEDKKEEEPEETKEEEAKAADEENSANLANTIDNLDLSAREKFNIQIQLRRCYKKAIEETKLSSKAKIIVKASINESGYIDSNIDEEVDMERYNDSSDPSYKIAIDNARRAMELCSPLRNLPLDKYNVWKEVTLQFDEGN
jgi:outer membrane biosynthesis protein TonB